VNESCHSYEWVMSLIWMSHVTHMNESCHSYEWVMSLIWMSHVPHIRKSCHTYEWVMSLIWMSHVTHMNESCHSYEWVTSLIWMSHVTHMNESCHSYTQVMSHMWIIGVKHANKPCHTHEEIPFEIHTHDSFICLIWFIYMCSTHMKGFHLMWHARQGMAPYLSYLSHILPRDGEIALWSATNCWYVVKCVSQKRNWSNNKNQWYNILVT